MAEPTPGRLASISIIEPDGSVTPLGSAVQGDGNKPVLGVTEASLEVGIDVDAIAIARDIRAWSKVEWGPCRWCGGLTRAWGPQWTSCGTIEVYERQHMICAAECVGIDAACTPRGLESLRPLPPTPRIHRAEEKARRRRMWVELGRIRVDLRARHPALVDGPASGAYPAVWKRLRRAAGFVDDVDAGRPFIASSMHLRDAISRVCSAVWLARWSRR